MKERRFLPTLADLVDRLQICQLKQVHLQGSDPNGRPYHDLYAAEIKDILHDIDLILEEQDVQVDARMIRAISVMMCANFGIWVNESQYRAGKTGEGYGNLELSHSINGVRNAAKNEVQKLVGQGRLDYKIDTVHEKYSHWRISWDEPNDETKDGAAN